jgi:lysophospholipase L1-like esterase
VSAAFAALGGAALLLAAVVGVFALANRGPRQALSLALAQNQRWIAPRVIVVGDSLAACCPFEKLSRRPLGVLTLAKGGATLKEIAGQILQAREIAARYVIIDGGLNDILFDDAPLERIEHDFRGLLRRLGDGATAIFTLMPYVADPAYAARIEAANRRMAALCEEHGVAVLDLNPELSSGGVRRPEMTDDGLHFSARANAVWIAAARRTIEL